MILAPSLGSRCAWARAESVPAREPEPVLHPARRANAPSHALSGYNTTRIVMEFMRWAVEREEFPTVEAIVRRFEVSRATAYRWRGYLAQTYCLETLPPNEHEIARIGKPGAKTRTTQAGGTGR